MNCFIPVTVRVTGRVDGPTLDQLADSIARAVGSRIAAADATIVAAWTARPSHGMAIPASTPQRSRARSAGRLRMRGADDRARSARFLGSIRQRVAAFRSATIGRIEGNVLHADGRSYTLSSAGPLGETDTVGSRLEGGAVYLSPTTRERLGVLMLVEGQAFEVYRIDAELRLHATGMIVVASGLSESRGILGYVEHVLRFQEIPVEARAPRDTASIAGAVIWCIDNLLVTLAPLQTSMAILANLEPHDLTNDEVMDVLRRVEAAGRLTRLVSLIQIPRFRAYLRRKGVPWEYIYSHWEPGVNDSGQLWAGFAIGAAENVYEGLRFFYVIIGSLFSDELLKEGREMAEGIKKFFEHPLVNAGAGIARAYDQFQEKLWNLEFFDAGRTLGNATVAVLTLYQGVRSLPKAIQALGQVTVNLTRLAVRQVLALGVKLDELGAFLRAPQYAYATSVGVTLIEAKDAVMVVSAAGAPIGLLPMDELVMMMAAAGSGGGLLTAQSLVDELRKRGFDKLVDDVLEDMDAHPDLAEHYLRRLQRLSDKELGALEAIRQADDATGGLGAGRTWFDVLDLPPAFRRDLLALVADVKDSVRNGLAEAVGRGLRANATDVQGVLGHFYAARTLKARYPGAMFDFEVPGIGREIDIRMTHKGRVIDVEVKTNLGIEPSIDDVQIARDLARHAADGWNDMLYLYAPQQSGNVVRVQNAMLRLLETPEVTQALAALGIDLATAQKTLTARFAQGLVALFDY